MNLIHQQGNLLPIVRNILFFLLITFLGIDLLLSAYHYYHLSFDGDLTKIGTPILWYEAVMKDPFGIHAIATGETYSGAGRYFCHLTTVWWCRYAYDFVYFFVKNPVVSIYLTTSALAMLVHVLFLLLMSLYLKATQTYNRLFTLLIFCFATLFIQYGEYYESIGIIDRSPSYIFFYGLQLMLFALYCFPFYRAFHQNKNSLHPLIHLFLICGAVVLTFGSVLIKPIIFVTALLMGFTFIFSKKESKFRKYLLNRQFLFHFIFLFSLSLYAFYISRFNSENLHVNTLSDRYQLLGEGIVAFFSLSPVYSIMGLIILFNLVLLKKIAPSSGFKLFSNQLLYIVLFCIIYLSLLPFGGYRTYRPLIIRYDTFLPVSLLLVYMLIATCVYLTKFLKLSALKYAYMGLLLIFAFMFTYADRNLESHHNDCQQEVLYYLYKNKDTLISMPRHCNVGTWTQNDYDDKYIMATLNKLYRRWKIIEPYQTLYAE